MEAEESYSLNRKRFRYVEKLFGLALALLATLAVSAQVRVGEGQLSGSFESNSIYYQDDSGLGAAGTAPDDRFGSNNYMKLDYMNGRFSAGLQIDAYLPALQGYEIGQQPGAYHFYLSSKYIQWQDHNYSVRVGDIFDQFGSGLIFVRSKTVSWDSTIRSRVCRVSTASATTSR